MGGGALFLPISRRPFSIPHYLWRQPAWLPCLANADCRVASIDRSSGGRAKESDQNQIRSASRSRHSLFTRRMHHQPQPPAPASFQDIHRDPTLEKYVKAFKHCLSFFSVDRISTSSMLHVTPYYSLFNVIIDHGTFFKILPHEKITTVF